MKFIPGDLDKGQMHRLELTRRNLQVLLAKLDDPLSARQLVDGDWYMIVQAVEGEEVVGVMAVEDQQHYADRAPGPVFMPSTGEVL